MAGSKLSCCTAQLKTERDRESVRYIASPAAQVRVPAVYLKRAFCPFLSLLPFSRINNLRIINLGRGFEPLQVHQLNQQLPPTRSRPASTDSYKVFATLEAACRFSSEMDCV